MTIEEIEGNPEEMDAPNTAAVIAAGLLIGSAVAIATYKFAERLDRRREARQTKKKLDVIIKDIKINFPR